MAIASRMIENCSKITSMAAHACVCFLYTYFAERSDARSRRVGGMGLLSPATRLIWFEYDSFMIQNVKCIYVFRCLVFVCMCVCVYVFS